MTRTLVTQVAKAIAIVCLSGLIVAGVTFKFLPAPKPYYSIMATQRSEKLTTTPDPIENTNDSDSRAITK